MFDFFFIFSCFPLFYLPSVHSNICHNECRSDNSSDVIMTGVVSIGDVDMLEFYVRNDVKEDVQYKIETCGPSNCT